MVVLALLVPPTGAVAQSGGTAAPGAPVVSAARCLAAPEEPCPRAGRLAHGRPAVLRGANLENVRTVTFLGKRGRADDRSARATEPGARRLTVVVPADAVSGRVAAVDRWDQRGITRRTFRIVDPPGPAPIDIAPGSRFFYDGRRSPVFAFTAATSGNVTVELLHEDGAHVARTWTLATEAGQRTEVRWDGRGSDGVERTGRYRFRVAGTVTSAAVQPETPFSFADHLFPIRGPHDLGQTRTNWFGGGRGHQGIDMFARCGTRLAAARGGRVQDAGYHRSAGYYLVIDGRRTGLDYVYMHMRSPSLVKTGQRVFTGQKVGEVGDSGNADGCHLHFELWSAPGWYQGGRPLDPRPRLAAWDRYS